MKHITYADKSVLVGNDAADMLLTYAAALASRGHAEQVTMHAFSSDGDEVDATFLLGAGAPLMAETTHSALPEPDNTTTVTEIQAKLHQLEHPDTITPDDLPAGAIYPADYDEFQPQQY